MTDHRRRRSSSGRSRRPRSTDSKGGKPRPQSAAALPRFAELHTDREVVYQSLADWWSSSRFISDLLQEQLPETLQIRRGFCLELLSGIVRRRQTLDVLLEHQSGRHRSHIEAPLRLLLWMGAYQLLFMDSVPDHAAIHETVELARRLGRNRWVGFANGVLRGLSRVATPHTTHRPARQHLPLRDGVYRELNASVFPCPETEPLEYFADAFSFPLWLARRWQNRCSTDVLFREAFWFNGPGRQFLRVNSLATTREDLLRALRAQDIGVEVGTLPESLSVSSGGNVTDTPEFAAGHFSIQDESAMHAVDLLAPRPGQRVLDLCAAPGTKATHLAERMQNHGQVLATDSSAQRLPNVAENCLRLGIHIVQPRLIASVAEISERDFDAILLDAPCSNTGVLGKRPESRWRLSERDIAELVSLQRDLLQQALGLLAAGGRLVYSTCSIEPEENSRLVRRVLTGTLDMELECERMHVPGRPADGAYQARIRRHAPGNV